MSIVRIGLAETKNFAEGYDAIFSKKKKPKAEAAPAVKPAVAAKPAAKKKAKKKK
ncbi:hypothetical protein BH10PLA2_BH10PLA2_37450 [soil metagenome]